MLKGIGQHFGQYLLKCQELNEMIFTTIMSVQQKYLTKTRRTFAQISV